MFVSTRSFPFNSCLFTAPASRNEMTVRHRSWQEEAQDIYSKILEPGSAATIMGSNIAGMGALVAGGARTSNAVVLL